MWPGWSSLLFGKLFSLITTIITLYYRYLFICLGPLLDYNDKCLWDFSNPSGRKRIQNTAVGMMHIIVNLLVIVSLPNCIFSLLYSVKFYTVQRSSICNNDKNYGNCKLTVSYIVVFVKQCFSKCGP